MPQEWFRYIFMWTVNSRPINFYDDFSFLRQGNSFSTMKSKCQMVIWSFLQSATRIWCKKIFFVTFLSRTFLDWPWTKLMSWTHKTIKFNLTHAGLTHLHWWVFSVQNKNIAMLINLWGFCVFIAAVPLLTFHS